MRARPSTPDEAFRNVALIHASFLVAAVIYVVVGEVNAWANEPFDGLGGASLQDQELWLRLGLLTFTAVNFVLAFLVYASEATVDRFVRSIKQEIPDTMRVAHGLTTTHILRIAGLQSPAILGLLLFLFGGERLDLYLFSGLAVAGLIATWPRRGEWGRTFRRHALANPAIPADPWQVAS